MPGVAEVPLGAVDQAVIATDLDGRVTHWNPVAERVFGWRATEVLGKRLAEVVGNSSDDAGQRILRETEQRFRSLFEHHPDPVFALDREGRYAALNPACWRRSGIRPERLIGQLYGDRSADPEEARQAVAAALGGQPLTFEPTLLLEDREVPEQVTLVPIIVDGITVGVYGVSKDMTERKRSETMAVLHARRQTAIAELGLLALTDINLEQLLQTSVEVVAGVLDVETAALVSLEASGEIRLRVGVGTRHTCLSADLVEDLVGGNGATAAGLVKGEGLATRLPGRSHPHGVLLAWTAGTRAYSDGDLTFLQGVANVVGAAIDHNIASDELRHRENEFRVLVEHTSDIIARFDDKLRVMYVNPAGEQMHAGPVAIGSALNELDLEESLIAALERGLRRVFRGGEEDELELLHQTQHGDRCFHVRLSPEFGANGEVNSVLAVGRDITANKQREAERSQLYHELLERDSRLHELVERVLLDQQEPRKPRPANAPALEQFTARERQILILLARGMTNREIGERVSLRPSTVKNYLATIQSRLNATDRTHAAVLAAQLGLLSE